MLYISGVDGPAVDSGSVAELTLGHFPHQLDVNRFAEFASGMSASKKRFQFGEVGVLQGGPKRIRQLGIAGSRVDQAL